MWAYVGKAQPGRTPDPDRCVFPGDEAQKPDLGAGSQGSSWRVGWRGRQMAVRTWPRWTGQQACGWDTWKQVPSSRTSLSWSRCPSCPQWSFLGRYVGLAGPKRGRGVSWGGSGSRGQTSPQKLGLKVTVSVCPGPAAVLTEGPSGQTLQALRFSSFSFALF